MRSPTCPNRFAHLQALDRLSLHLADGEVQALSLGNQQRVQLAAALVGLPELLILDEPFSGLDPVAVDVMSQVLRERAEAGVPTLLSSHQLDIVERLCDRVVIIRAGRLVAGGSIDELQSTAHKRWRAVVSSDLEPRSARAAADEALGGLPDPVWEVSPGPDSTAVIPVSAAGPTDQPLLAAAHRLGVTGADAQAVAALEPALSQIQASDGGRVEVVALAGTGADDALAEDAPAQTRVDIVLKLGAPPTLTVLHSADEAVVAGVISLLQQQALAAQVAQLGGDPATIGRAVSDATPDVTELDPPERGTADFQARYAVLLFADMVLLVAIMFGGQAITTGVVEEKSSRIVEILLACVRPASLLAGKILGIGAAIILSWGLVVVAATATAHALDVLPSTDLDLNTAAVGILVWMLIGYALVSALFGAAGALVSRQEDVSGVTSPLAIAVLTLPLLVKLSAVVYTRAITRSGSRVPLRQVLSRG